MRAARATRKEYGASAQLPEEILQQHCRFALADAAVKLGPVVARALRENARAVFHAAPFGIARPPIEAAQARERDRLRAHGTRLERDVEIEAVEPCLPTRCRGRADRQHFGVRGRVAVALDAVVGGGHDRAGVRIDHDGADRHFARLGGLFCLVEGQFHIAHGANVYAGFGAVIRGAMKIPRIGITLDSEPAGGWSKMPWYAVRQNYCDAVVRAGGLPLVLPHEAALADAYLDGLDGLLVTGGAFDVDPALFGAASKHASVTTKDRRTEFEYAMVKGALARDLPILGICGGEQLLNVVLGGTLHQHIPDEIPGALAHEQPNPRTEPGHSVAVVPGTLLHRTTARDTMQVNSAHHQAVKDVGPGVCVNARAPDGVIEGIELPGKRFCLGVEWHPEYSIDPGDERIFSAFVAASAGR